MVILSSFIINRNRYFFVTYSEFESILVTFSDLNEFKHKLYYIFYAKLDWFEMVFKEIISA